MNTRSIDRTTRRAALPAAIVLVLAVAGCGGGGGIESPAEPRDGKTIFVEYCGACHTLSAAGTDGGAGPNLDDLKPGRETVATQVRNGGGGMPAYSGKLSAAEIEVISKFVADNAGR